MKRRMLFVVIAINALTNVARATDTSVPFIHADLVHALGITGFGVTVAVIDTGVNYGEQGLAGDIAPGGVSIINGVPIPDGGADPNGPGGHGTLVSLIITNSCGVAPDAKILPVRVTGATGVAHWRDTVKAIRYVISQRKADPSIRVINLSLGDGTYACQCDWTNKQNGQYWLAITDALEAGIVTFVATGNDADCGGLNSPGCISTAVKVAASYDDYYGLVTYPDLCTDPYPPPYYVTCFSSIAENCMYLLAAPGYDITIGGFEHWWGTSCATPHCSGVAALMFSKIACGNVSAVLVRQTIWSTATSHDFGYAWCYLSPQPKHVDALTAVNAVGGPTCPVPGDLDCDALVSGYDFPGLETCMSGARAVS